MWEKMRPSCHILPPSSASSPRRWINSQHTSTKAGRLLTAHLTRALQVQWPRWPHESQAEEDDKHLSVAQLLIEGYDVELMDQWLVDASEKRELLQGSQELAGCPPRPPHWALWILTILRPQRQLVRGCREPGPIDHPQENHPKLRRSLEGKTDGKEERV